jgi:putative heme transporter
VSRTRMSGRARSVLRTTIAGLVSLVLLALLLPVVSGAPWHDIRLALSVPTPVEVALLALLWAAGLVVHCRVLTAALPGLTVRRALTLNLTGSAVANVVPLGGGLGLGMNYVMVRRWGFSPGQFSLFTAVVNAWHVTAKALLPAAAVLLLVANDVPLHERLLGTAVVGSAALLLAVAAAAAAVMTRRGGQATGWALDSVLHAVRRRPVESMAVRIEALRLGARTLVRSAWRPMTWGLLAYNALQALLLWACLAAVGGPLPLVLVVAVFAVERAVTVLPLTPGGAGVVEIAATAMIVALGGEPAAAAAGILLYRAFVFGLEIPVGGAWLLGWWISQRGRPVAA